MTKEKFGKVIKFSGRDYRYNEKEALLEWVTKTDFDFDKDDNLIEIKLDDWKVVDAVGLSREGAEKDLMGYISQWHDEIDEETAFEMKMEFGDK